MNRKHVKGFLKHGDFMLLDVLIMQVSFILSYFLFRGIGNPYANPLYQYQAVVLFISQLLVILFSNNYSGILRRKHFDELVAVIRYMGIIMVLVLTYLFFVHNTGVASRLQYGFTSLFFVILGFFVRTLNKTRVIKSKRKHSKKSVVLITSGDLVEDTMWKLIDPNIYQDYFISGIILLSGENEGYDKTYGIPVLPLGDEAIKRLIHGWVDEVFILQPDNIPFPSDLMNQLVEMGITVNYTISALNDERWSVIDMRKLGRYKVLTNSVRFISAGEMAVKRAADIVGGLVGCVLTGILFIFIAPIIYKESPGPIFFAQERIGKNGKKFKLHKFRSMYLDAEDRLAALMAQNEMDDSGKNLMFKMSDDPRIIGSEKRDKNGNPKGIGNFIRNTSIDEFPQFYDCLIGNMSLVGWRPCTLNEWEQYDLEHRIRASMKPGITGMWQVSGRNKITDFNEVVALDREYIENWSLLLDIKILLKTVWVVIARKGAE